ncbi:MAG: hypothetical protein ACM359_15610 [Bacillota bacterium]
MASIEARLARLERRVSQSGGRRPWPPPDEWADKTRARWSKYIAPVLAAIDGTIEGIPGGKDEEVSNAV